MKKTVSLLLAVIMVLSLLPVTARAVESQEPVTYISRAWDDVQEKVVETTETCYSYELLHNSNSSWYTIGQEGQKTWYVAKGKITMNGTTLTVRGDVNIILCDGANVRIYDGIEVKTGYSLTIYAQDGGNGELGKLYAKNNRGDAGIGCGPNSGVGDITIHGGVIEARGGKYAAGIGSGDERAMGSHIRIYGGDINAHGGDYGAGIGSGDETGGEDGWIDIYGGKVYAKGGIDAAGIGGGNEGNGRHITIWGGEVEAHGSSTSKFSDSAGIGGGDDGGGGYITINGGVVKATSEADGPGIGGDTNCGVIVINGGTVTAIGKEGGTGIGGALAENLVKGSITINGGDVTASSVLQEYWNDEHFHSYEEGSAGIGSGSFDLQSGGGGDLKIPITINGGHVRAIGVAGSAGIGSGSDGDVTGQITITGGFVEAYSDIGSAGIGAGSSGDVEKKIIISGGTVIAWTGDLGSAQVIGHGGGGATSAGVELYDEAMVYAGSSEENAELLEYDDRLSGPNKNYVRIEPCGHESCTTYAYVNGLVHNIICDYCGHPQEEEHIFGYSGVCDCGLSRTASDVRVILKVRRSGDPANQYESLMYPVRYGTNYALPRPQAEFSSDRYQFAGWKVGIISTIRKPGYILKKVDTETTVTAQYTEYCRISFIPNGGVGNMADVWVAKGKTYKLPACAYAYDTGYVFTGWWVNGQLMQPGQTITVTADMELGVHWAEPVHKHGDTTFTALGNVYDLEHEPGNYYLNYLNITLPHTFYAAGEYSVCLNGHELYITETNDGLSGLTVPNGVTLNIYDETGEGLITILENYANDPIDTPVITVENGGVVNFYGGKIKGVKSSGVKGGGVCVKAGGTFNLYGGTITENSTAGQGGGVYVEAGGTLNLSGGRITGNRAAGQGGGVYVENGGSFTVSGNVKVIDNCRGIDTISNVYLEDEAVITVIGALDALIGIPAAEGREIPMTSGLNGNGTAESFVSDDSSCVVGLDAAGEVVLGAPVIVSFVDGSGETDSTTAALDSTYTLPECVFELPEAKILQEWLVKIGENEPVSMQPGDTFVITEETTVTAVYAQAYEYTFHEPVVPTYDAETNTYIDGSIGHYTSAEREGCFAYDADTDSYIGIAAENVVVRYFRIDKNSDGVVRIMKYNGADEDVTVPDTVPAELATNMEAGEAITSINQSAFKGNTVIRKITLGDNISHIGWQAFYNASNLEEVEIGSGLERTESGVFVNCPSLRAFTCTTVTNANNKISTFRFTFDEGASSRITLYGPHTGVFHDLRSVWTFTNDEAYTYIGIDEHDAPVWVWADDCSSAAATFSCGGCSFTSGPMTAEVSSMLSTDDPEQAYMVYTAAVSVDDITYTDVRRVPVTVQTISFDGGIGSGEMDPAVVVSGSEYVLPECEFEAPEDSAFAGWLVGDEMVQPGEAIHVTEDVTVTAQWGALTEPVFRTQNLILSGKIGLSFNMALPELDGVDYSTSYMTFKIGNSSEEERVDYSADGKKASGNQAFVVYVNSIQMAEPITAVFHYEQSGVEKTVTKTYSVEDYFAAFEKAVADGKITDEATIDLTRALTDYGHYVQPFLAEARGWTLGTDYAALDTYYTGSYGISAIKDAVAGMALGVPENIDDEIKAITHSLTLDSDTVINVYFKPAAGYSGGFTAVVDNDADFELETLSDGRYCVRIKGIAAHELSRKFTITFTTETRTETVTVSALSYVNSALKHYSGTSDTDVNAQNAAAAIYAYSQAADAYKAAQSNG